MTTLELPPGYVQEGAFVRWLGDVLEIEPDDRRQAARDACFQADKQALMARPERVEAVAPPTPPRDDVVRGDAFYQRNPARRGERANIGGAS